MRPSNITTTAATRRIGLHYKLIIKKICHVNTFIVIGYFINVLISAKIFTMQLSVVTMISKKSLKFVFKVIMYFLGIFCIIMSSLPSLHVLDALDRVHDQSAGDMSVGRGTVTPRSNT